MKLLSENRFNVIVLVPVAIYAASGNGCATTPVQRPGPLTKIEIEDKIPGNTFKLADEEVYALIREDGTLGGLNLPSGAVAGRWRVSDNGVLCAAWKTAEGDVENCDVLAFFSEDIGYQWGGNTMLLLEGNPKNL